MFRSGCWFLNNTPNLIPDFFTPAFKRFLAFPSQCFAIAADAALISISFLTPRCIRKGPHFRKYQTDTWWMSHQSSSQRWSLSYHHVTDLARDTLVSTWPVRCTQTKQKSRRSHDRWRKSKLVPSLRSQTMVWRIISHLSKVQTLPVRVQYRIDM